VEGVRTKNEPVSLKPKVLQLHINQINELEKKHKGRVALKIDYLSKNGHAWGNTSGFVVGGGQMESGTRGKRGVKFQRMPTFGYNRLDPPHKRNDLRPGIH